MRFPIKRSALIEDEFKAAIDMCNNENKKDIFTHIYKAVKVIDRNCYGRNIVLVL